MWGGGNFSTLPDKIGIFCPSLRLKWIFFLPPRTKIKIFYPLWQFFACDPLRQFYPILPSSDRFPANFPPSDSFFLPISPSDCYFINSTTLRQFILTNLPPSDIFFNDFTPSDSFYKIHPYIFRDPLRTINALFYFTPLDKTQDFS